MVYSNVEQAKGKDKRNGSRRRLAGHCITVCRQHSIRQGICLILIAAEQAIGLTSIVTSSTVFQY